MKIKCETCLSAESIAQQQPQIFVVATAPADASGQPPTVKYEPEPVTTQVVTTQQQQAQQTNLGTQNTIPIGVKTVTGMFLFHLMSTICLTYQ